MIQQNISVTKTARYFILGEADDNIEQVWFVCHGYAQLANYFLKKFEFLNTGKNLIVAPEGLHRFYWQGFSGRVVASWMTKEDRVEDIKDYVNFLDQVASEVLKNLKKEVIVNVLGFSQGTATACRWLAQGKIKADYLILHSGVFPPDLNFAADKIIFNQLKECYFLMGDADEFTNLAQNEKHMKELEEKGIHFEKIIFKGKHEINSPALLQLSSHFSKDFYKR